MLYGLKMQNCKENWYKNKEPLDYSRVDELAQWFDGQTFDSQLEIEREFERIKDDELINRLYSGKKVYLGSGGQDE